MLCCRDGPVLTRLECFGANVHGRKWTGEMQVREAEILGDGGRGHLS